MNEPQYSCQDDVIYKVLPLSRVGGHNRFFSVVKRLFRFKCDCERRPPVSGGYFARTFSFINQNIYASLP